MTGALRAPLAIALAICVVALGGCGSPDGQKAADVEGAWMLESFGRPQGLEPAAEGVTTEMTLADGKATGNGGVNSFGADYLASDGGKIEFREVVSTRMAGEQTAMDQESEFFAALADARSFEIDEGKLVLSNVDNDTLVVMRRK